MIEISINSQQLEGAVAHFKNKGESIENFFKVIFKKAGLTVEREAKIYSPVRTGRLRASIITNVSTFYATVGPTVFYAPFVHARTPFMQAARTSAMPKIRAAINLIVQKALGVTARPMSQIEIENAYNSGDMAKVEELINKLPDTDPFKKSMRHLFLHK